MGVKDAITHAWNAFRSNKDPTKQNYGVGSMLRPGKYYSFACNEKSIVTAVQNKIAVDAAQIQIQHVKLDENGKYLNTINSGLNNCLNVEANIDQTGRAFIQDAVMSLLDEGVIAIVPIDTTIDPEVASFGIDTMRTGKIIEWYPKYVKVEVYNDQTGRKEQRVFPKSTTAIVENPFYSVMNEPNSTMQRLKQKLSMLDTVDEKNATGKLDLILQFPFQIRGDMRKQQAKERRKELLDQLNEGDSYGVAYTDGSEKVIQLNRSLENQLFSQVEYLTNLMLSQLGITTEILNGTASESAMMNYQSRIIEPIIAAIVDEMKRKFLSKTARTQHQSIIFFKDPFKLVPVSQVADIADKFTRNEIMSSNEVRQIVGMKPVAAQQADELRNKNINATEGQQFATTEGDQITEQPAVPEEGMPPADEQLNEAEYLSAVKDLDDIDAELDELEKGVKKR